jgi:transcriptional regulator GlxA family with amidase domain
MLSMRPRTRKDQRNVLGTVDRAATILFEKCLVRLAGRRDYDQSHAYSGSICEMHNAVLIKWIRQVCLKRELVLSVGNGALLLAKTELLDRRSSGELE